MASCLGCETVSNLTCRHEERVHDRLPGGFLPGELQLEAVQGPTAQYKVQYRACLGGLLNAPSQASLHNAQLFSLPDTALSSVMGGMAVSRRTAS